MLTRTRARSIGWAAILGLCFAMTLALTFRVNAVRSQVRLTERKIVALKTEKGMLETEFETRANQQQLRNLNDVEFGYQAPTAGQYLESERQLAMLGKPSGPNAPEPIRVASADPADGPEQSGDSILPAMVNPLTGKALAVEMPGKDRAGTPQARAASASASRLASARDSGSGETLAERLGRVEHDGKTGSKVERLSHVERDPLLLKAAKDAKTAKDVKVPKDAKVAGKDTKAARDAKPARPALAVKPAVTRALAAKTPAAGKGEAHTAQKATLRSAPKTALKTAPKTPSRNRVAIDE